MSSDPWRLVVREYHGAAEVQTQIPSRTLFRKRLRYRTRWIHRVSGGFESRRSAISEAMTRVPLEVEYEIVTDEREPE